MASKRPSRLLIGFLAALAFTTYFSATFASISAAKVTLYSPTSRVLEDNSFVSCVIPQSALVLDEEVFIAVERQDIWGSSLEAVPVQVVARDLGDGMAAVVEGLTGYERVIVSWDRPLDFGMRVIEK